MTALLNEPTIKPLFQTIELNVGQSTDVQANDDQTVRIELLDLTTITDELRKAVRQTFATVKINDQTITLEGGNYNMPVKVEGIQIDCPITNAYFETCHQGNVWQLDADVRLRIWPSDSPLTNPGTFAYPAKQKWFATATQAGNEPVWVCGSDRPDNNIYYYHWGVDIGGADGLTQVVAATDGLIVGAGDEILPSLPEDNPVRPRYDLVYIYDDRGWFYRYSHFDSIDPSIKVGNRVKLGDPLGILGKEGYSGGWAHLHFDAISRQPNGQWGIQNAYPLLADAYCRQFDCKLFACARPHLFAAINKPVTLDATRSYAKAGITRYQWQFSDGTTADVPKIEKTYDTPGTYCETLKITDADGNEQYDFAYVFINDPAHPDQGTPAIHAACHPTTNLKAGQPINFLVRMFGSNHGQETWNFGDGSDPVSVKSNGNRDLHDKNGYARTQHTYTKPGRYFVSVSRTSEYNHTATARLVIDIE